MRLTWRQVFNPWGFVVAFIGLLLIALLSGCNVTPQATQTSSNAKITMELLTTWEDDGATCKLWRVWDGKYVYVARCGGVRAYAEWQSGGKTKTTHRVDANTLEAAR